MCGNARQPTCSGLLLVGEVQRGLQLHCSSALLWQSTAPRYCRPGASEEALAAAELELGVRLPPALRVLYRLHDGQGLQFDASVDSQRVVAMHPSIFHGLFGG